MTRWITFPPNARIRLFYARPGGGEPVYLLRSAEMLPPSYLARGWSPVPGLERSWSAPGAVAGRPGAFPAAWMKRHGGKSEDLDDEAIRRRFLLRGCPRDARLVGVNARGEDVREDESGHRWLLWNGMPPGWSWAGGEKAHPFARTLRFNSRQRYRELARSLAAEAARGARSLDDAEIGILAEALVRSPARNFRPLFGDPGEARRALLEELVRACMEPAGEAGGDRGAIWARARALERAFPSLARPGEASASPSLASALAAVAGPLREAKWLGPGDAESWTALCRGAGEDAPAIFDGRGLDADEAAGELAEFARARTGRIVAALSADLSMPELRQARAQIARGRGIEAAMHLPAEALGGEPLSLISIGAGRPRELADPPPQAMRLAKGSTREDLRAWAEMAIYGRERIAGADAPGSDRLVPYTPLCGLGGASCMIPRGHQAAAAAAGRRLAKAAGDIGGYAARLLGTSREELDGRLSPEQIDAVALAEHAHERGRAFLLADQTGTGKGRALASCAAAWLRGGEDRRAIYVTVDAQVARDVVRDIRNAGVAGIVGPPALIGSGMAPPDPAEDAIVVAGDRERRDLFASGGLPPGSRFAILAYSQFQAASAAQVETKTDRQRLPAEWLENTCDSRTMLILDECHKALNRESNTGATMRLAIEGAGRTLFGSATALKDAEGLDFYRPLMPAGMSPRDAEAVFRNVAAGGETAYESFVTMLVEDGVMIRRDHDTGLAAREISRPVGAEGLRAREAMAAFRTVAERVVRASRAVNAALAAYRPERRDRRTDQEIAASFNAPSFGAPLERMSGAVLSALKASQVARVAADELNLHGRKPLIAIDGTAGSFLEKLASGDPAAAPRYGAPELRDRLRAIAESVYLFRDRDEQWRDARRMGPESPEVRQAEAALDEAISTMPAGLPASPIDAILDGLRERGLEAGEITSRKLRLGPTGRAEARKPPPKADVAAAYNSGELDALVFNKSGGTGASYHAGADFADRRPRTIIQAEISYSVLDHIQQMGRGNRFDQIAQPKFVTISTGTAPENRLLALSNRKLREVGAILDADRAHPAIAKGADIPDILNEVGGRAIRTVLADSPEIDERLGRIGGPSKSDEEIARSLMARCILLGEDEQDRLFAAVREEFDALVEDLDAAGRNPLRVPTLEGYVELRDSEDFASRAVAAPSEESVFYRPLSLAAGVWHAPPGVDPDTVSAAALEARTRIRDAGGGDSPASPLWHARRLEARGGTIAGEAEGRHGNAGDGWSGPIDEDLRNLIATLRGGAPGSVWSLGLQTAVLVDYIPPASGEGDAYPGGSRAYAHRFRAAFPGESKFQTISASTLLDRFAASTGMNVLDGEGFEALAAFSPLAERNARPVQVLSGNLVGSDFRDAPRRGAAAAGREFRICNFVDSRGASVRAAVNSASPHEFDLTRLPFACSADTALLIADSLPRDAAPLAIRQETRQSLMRREGSRSYLFRLNASAGRLTMALPRWSRERFDDFWKRDTGPELYRLFNARPMPGRFDSEATPEARSTTWETGKPAERAIAARACALLDAHSAAALMAPGKARGWWRDIGRGLAAARSPQWEPASPEEAEQALERLLASGGGAAPAAQLAWPGAAAEFHALPAGGDPGAIVSAPRFDRRNAEFWSAKPAGGELWRMLAGRALPRVPLPGSAGRISAFLPAGDALAAFGLVRELAEARGGGLVNAAAGAAEPDRRNERAAELAA